MATASALPTSEMRPGSCLTPLERLARRCRRDRAIAVVRAAHGAVWFDFGALCGGPRSQEDYIEIAREFQSVFVSDVPLLDADREDEARRFVALVDELYDRNVNLVMSAAAAPPQLYGGTRVRAEFARTVSRLTEMQSQDYLAREHRA